MDGACSCPVGYGCKHIAAVLIKVLEARNAAPQINPAVLQWLENFRRSVEVKKKTATSPAKRLEQLFYLLRKHAYNNTLEIIILKGRADLDGRPHPSTSSWNNIERALLQPPKFVDEEDIAILRALWALRNRDSYSDAYPLSGHMGEDALKRMLDSGRLFYVAQFDHRNPYRCSPALKLGAERQGKLEWQPDNNGEIVPNILVYPDATAVITLETAWYVDANTEEVGLLNLPFSAGEMTKLATLPPLRAIDVQCVATALRELAPDLPMPGDISTLRTIETTPQPVITFATAPLTGFPPIAVIPMAVMKLIMPRHPFVITNFRLRPAVRWSLSPHPVAKWYISNVSLRSKTNF